MTSPTIIRKPGPADLAVLAKTLAIPAADIPQALPSLSVCACQDGTAIVKEGEAGGETFVILKGQVSVRESRWIFLHREVARLSPGEIFGEINFLVPTARSASVVALDGCEVARIAAGDLKAHLERNPELRSGLEELARRRLYALSSRPQP